MIIIEETFKEYIKTFEKYLHRIEFLDAIVIVEASEMMLNLKILNELERLGEVTKLKRNKINISLFIIIKNLIFFNPTPMKHWFIEFF